MTLTMICIKLSIQVLLLVQVVLSFEAPVVVRRPSSSHVLYDHGPSAARGEPGRMVALRYSTLDDSDEQGITPNQIKQLRKESARRVARKELPRHFFVEMTDSSSSDDGGDQSAPSFLEELCQSLRTNELCQVRGISRNSKRKVLNKAEQLAYDLSFAMRKEVTLAEVKGHTATLYCPSDDVEGHQKIKLRSSYQEGAWEKRAKAPRDHRGQIVTQEEE